ncbi:hypothetical protein [Acidithiobacillus sp.]
MELKKEIRAINETLARRFPHPVETASLWILHKPGEGFWLRGWHECACPRAPARIGVTLRRFHSLDAVHRWLNQWEDLAK